MSPKLRMSVHQEDTINRRKKKTHRMGEIYANHVFDKRSKSGTHEHHHTVPKTQVKNGPRT